HSGRLWISRMAADDRGRLSSVSRVRDVSFPPDPLQGDLVTQIIEIANQKGGRGKTTASINLGGALAELGYRVLCIDMDPQANLPVGLGLSLSGVRPSTRDVLSENRVPLDEIVRQTEMPGLSVAPSTLELASTEVELFTAIGREMVLRDALDGCAARQ